MEAQETLCPGQAHPASARNCPAVCWVPREEDVGTRLLRLGKKVVGRARIPLGLRLGLESPQ